MSSNEQSTRRRGGRRALNPEMSAEDRKRQRVLKNRESAMRSLAKKAEYSRMLNDNHTNVQSQIKTAVSNLSALVSDAQVLRQALCSLPAEAIANETLTDRADSVIASSVAAIEAVGDLNEEEDQVKDKEDKKN